MATTIAAAPASYKDALLGAVDRSRLDCLDVWRMADFLIRGLPEDALAAIDSQARRLGLSRNEYVRRQLKIVAQRSAMPVTVGDLRRFSGRFADLTDPDVIDQAWK